jgi:hypothetical protein
LIRPSRRIRNVSANAIQRFLVANDVLAIATLPPDGPRLLRQGGFETRPGYVNVDASTILAPQFGRTKPLRVFAALAAAKTGLDWRGEMGSSEEPQLWSFQVGRLGGGRHGVARDGLVSVKLVGVGGAWAIESDGN